MTTMNDQVELLKEEMKKKVKQFDIGFTRFIHPKVSYDKDNDIVDIELSVTVYRNYKLSGMELRHHPKHVTDHIKMMFWQFESSARHRIYETLVGYLKPKTYGYELVADTAIPKGIIFCHPETVMNIRHLDMNTYVAGEVVGAIADSIMVEDFHDISVKFEGESNN